MSMLSNEPATPTLTKYDVVSLTAVSLMLLLNKNGFYKVSVKLPGRLSTT
jgi:hypothetical protein